MPDAPRIVVFANDALGNFFAVQPLLQMLRAKYPAAKLELWAGERVAELAVRDAAISSFQLQYRPSTATVVRELLSREAPVDWVINVENSAWPMSLASDVAMRTSGTLLRGSSRAITALGIEPSRRQSRQNISEMNPDSKNGYLSVRVSDVHSVSRQR